MNIVWFKRDLRIRDHAPLYYAAEKGPFIPLYILEPELWRQPDMSSRQYRFLIESLTELDKSLQNLGQGLIIKVGNAIDIFEKLHESHSITEIWSHQETWNSWTYDRDKLVKKWTKRNNIIWHEPQQNGVIRALQDRNGWSHKWFAQMNTPVFMPPKKIPFVMETAEPIPSETELGLEPEKSIHIQKGGRIQGIELLRSFLYERGEGYTKEMSSPLTAFNSCSRLSPHIAFGTLSIREIFQALERRKNKIDKRIEKKWSSALRSFSGRLLWHCHFIQKLEDEPRIEFENLHTTYDSLRKENFNESYFTAWKEGKTGYPMVDACMRALTATGWINFRMRAMLMSFASYHLWLDWRKPALHLAKLFVDYEPGIHYSQVQMQSGTTGINSIRIYNPVKQGIDQDPNGEFIRKWVPELSDVPHEYIHTPWEDPRGLTNYPAPIVDEKTARKYAAEQLYGLRKNPEHKKTAKNIFTKHGSRKSGLSSNIRKARKTKKENSKQSEFPF